MSEHLDRAEEHRDLVAGLEYEEGWEATLADGLDDDSGYEPDDPKSPGYHDRMVAIWDDRDKTEGLA